MIRRIAKLVLFLAFGVLAIYVFLFVLNNHRASTIMDLSGFPDYNLLFMFGRTCDAYLAQLASV